MNASAQAELPDLIRRFYRATDERRIDDLRELLSSDARVRFGNAPEVVGRDAILAQSAGRVAAWKSMRHHFVDAVQDGNRIFSEFIVEYLMPDERVHRLPFASLIVHDGNQIRSLRVFGDLTPLLSVL
jgi:ketosteroid isomerase-like protein